MVGREGRSMPPIPGEIPGLFALSPLPGRFTDPFGAVGAGGFGLASEAGFETMGLDPIEGLAEADGAGRFP